MTKLETQTPLMETAPPPDTIIVKDRPRETADRPLHHRALDGAAVSPQLGGSNRKTRSASKTRRESLAMARRESLAPRPPRAWEA